MFLLYGRYDNMVFEVVVGLKEFYGFSNVFIVSYIEVRWYLFVDWMGFLCKFCFICLSLFGFLVSLCGLCCVVKDCDVYFDLEIVGSVYFMLVEECICKYSVCFWSYG